MLSLLLLKLSGFVLWSTVLSLLLVVLRRKHVQLLQWPTLYWWLLLLASAPLWPLWQWPVAIPVPNLFLLDAAQQIGQLTATVQHPAVLHWQPVELLLQVCLVVLVFGGCWHLWQLARQYFSLQALYQQARPVALAELFSAEQPLPALDPRLKMTEIRVHGLALSPFIFGGRHAVLMLPAYYWQFDNQQRALLLAHELQHWQRRDPWQLLGWQIIVAIGWFNPALRYFERSFCQAMELTVDRQVLAAQPQQALLYGQTLLSSLKWCQQQSNPGLASFIQASSIHASVDDVGYKQRLAALFQSQSGGQSSRLRFWLPSLLLSLAILLNIGCSALQDRAGPSGEWVLPVATAQVNSGYGAVSAIRQNQPHRGIDFHGRTGDPVFASADGLVLIADSHSLNARFGNTLLLHHGQGYQTLYAHLDTFSVQSGTRVRAGQQIGVVGASGVTSGPHLHFELLQHGHQLDPTSLLLWNR